VEHRRFVTSNGMSYQGVVRGHAVVGAMGHWQGLAYGEVRIGLARRAE
jgi:hypothetical protein